MSAVTAIEATRMVRVMTKAEQADGEPVEDVLRKLARRIGLSFWTLSHFRKGNAKTCDGSVGERIRTAYLDFCAREVAKLEHELELHKAAGGNALGDLEAEISAVAAKVRLARKANPSSAGPFSPR